MNERIKELDSLRGIAIIIVIAGHIFKRANNFTHHATLYFITNLTSIGWVGVDIFFALSGFLITSILLQTKDEKNYFRNFYVRRALRIFPLYYVYIFIILAFLPVLDPGFTSNIPRVLPFLLLYQQNWISIMGITVLTAYLAATWSLAIEEQFYLIWPSIVYFTRKEILAKISIGIIVLSILARIPGVLLWDSGQAGKFFYFNTFSRFEQLLFGALLAIAFTDPVWKERIRLFSLPTFLVALPAFLGLFIMSFPNTIPYYGSVPLTLGGYTLASIFSTALIAVLITFPEKSVIRRLFQSKGTCLAFKDTCSR